MLNRVVLIGRLSKDPEIRHTQSEKDVATFTLAVDRKYKQGEADFIPVVVWGKAAENCVKYLAKGKLAAVDGRLQLRNYTDKEGVKRLSAEIEADDVRFLSPKPANGGASAVGIDSNANEDMVGDDDLPF